MNYMSHHTSQVSVKQKRHTIHIRSNIEKLTKFDAQWGISCTMSKQQLQKEWTMSRQYLHILGASTQLVHDGCMMGGPQLNDRKDGLQVMGASTQSSKCI